MLAALLSAGLTPAQALQHAGLSTTELSQSVKPSALSYLAEVWSYGLTTGASLSHLLTSTSEAMDEAAENARQAQLQLAGPQAATKLVMVLPVLALAGGMAAGYNPIPFLLFQPVGWMLVVAAGGLLWFAHRWSGRMVASSQRVQWASGMPAEALAMALRSGRSLPQAQAWATRIAQDYLSSEQRVIELKQCEEYVRLGTDTGVALAELLRVNAQMLRAQARADARIAVEKLSVKLMVPLGVCVLPAFIAVGVLPLVASIISSTRLNS